MKGFFWRLGERLSSQLVSFVVSVVLARLLLPQEYGTIALCMVFVNITSVLAVSGLGTSLIQKKDADILDFSTIFYAGLGISLLLYGLLFVSASWVADLYKDDKICAVLRILGLVIPVQALNSVQQASVSRKLDFKKFFYATSIGTIASGLIGIFMAYTGYGVWALVGQQLSNHLINALTLNRIIDWHPTLQFSFQRFKSLFRFGSRLMLANFLGTFFNELKSFIVGFKYSPADLAFYNRGESLPNLVSSNMNNTMNAVLFPAISLVQDNKDDVKRAVRRSMITGSFVIFPLLFLLAAAAKNIVLILLTEKWFACVPFMQVFCLGHCVSILGTANIQACNAIGRSDITLKLEFYKKPVYVVAIFAGMFISPLAIAIFHAIYVLIGTLINTIPNKRLLGYTFTEQLSDVIPQFLLAVVMAAIVYTIGFLDWNIWIILFMQITIGLGIYWAGAILFSLDSYKYVLYSLQTFYHPKHKKSIMKFKKICELLPKLWYWKKASWTRSQWFCYDVMKFFLIYKDNDELQAEEKKANCDFSDVIWIYWRQGEKNAPDIVQKCIQSVRNNCGSHRVIVLDAENLSDYIEMPDFIMQKLEMGKIKDACFSDLLRISLLLAYGGIWCDATCFLSAPVDNMVEKSSFFMFNKSLLYLNTIPSDCSSWFIKSEKGNVALRKLRNVLFHYFKKYSLLPDYYIFHITLGLLVRADKEVAEVYNKKPYICNMNPHVLLFSLDKPYNEMEYKQILGSCFIHKLTYKYNPSLLKAKDENMLQHFMTIATNT